MFDWNDLRYFLRVLAPPRDLAQPVTLLVHPDLRNAPRLRAFFDFIVAGIDTLRPLMSGQTHHETLSDR
jgi:hypothetical protein